MLVLFFFLYVGAEVGYGNWIFTYATKSSLSGEKAAAYLTSVFWGSFTLGRLVGIPISSRFKPVAIMFVDLVGCLVSMGIVLVWADSLTALWIGTFGLGFSMASIFPSAMILAGQRMHLSGQVTGFFLFGAGSGGMFLPLLIGQLIEPVGPRSMMWIVLVDLVVNLALWLGLLLYKPKLARSD
jgi:FHS family Na+ dependent glucose MFS transporter 1